MPRSSWVPQQSFRTAAVPVIAIGFVSGAATIAWMALDPSTSIEALMLPLSVLLIVAVVRNWRLGLLVVAVAVPLEALSLPGTSLTIARFIVPVTILSMLHDASSDEVLMERVRSSLRSTPIRFLLAFLGWSVASVAWADSMTEWAGQIPATVGFVALVFLVSVADRRLISRVWLAALVAAAGGVFVPNWFAGSQEYIAQFDRLSVGGANPNGVAVLFAAAVGVALGGWQRRGYAVVVSMIAGTVAAGAIVLTGSRSGVLALLAAVAGSAIVSLLRYYKSERFGRIGFSFRQIAVGALAVMLIGLTMSVVGRQTSVDYSALTESGVERILTLAEIDDESDLSRRLEIWEAMALSVRSHPIAGVGAGNDSQASLREGVLSSSNSDRGAGSHNTAIQVLVDLGLVGLALYGTPWFIGLRSGVRYLVSGDRLAVGLVLGTAAWVVGGLVLNLMDEKFAALLLGGLLSFYNSSADEGRGGLGSQIVTHRHVVPGA